MWVFAAMTPQTVVTRIPPADLDSWHSSLQDLYGYWQRIGPPDGLPGRQHLDPLDIAPYLSQLWLLDVHRDPFRLRYRVVGTRIVEITGRELTGLWLDEAHPHLVNHPEILARYQAAVETGVPSRRKGKPAVFLAHQADYTLIENALFPLARDGKVVDMVMAYTVFYQPNGREF